MEAPDALLYLWRCFCDLSNARPSGMGPGAITYTGILAYCTLTATHLSAWEVSVIRALDNCYLQVMNG